MLLHGGRVAEIARGGTLGNFVVNAVNSSTTSGIGNMESSAIVSSTSNPLARLPRSVSKGIGFLGDAPRP